MADLLHDVRRACRAFSTQRGFTVAAVLTVAIGIGASTAIFSVVNAVLLRPLPYPESDRIVRIRSERPGPAGQQMDVFVTDVLLQAWSAEGKTLEHVAAYTPNSYTVRSIDTVERIQGMRVSPSMFALLRTTPQLGRLFLPDEAAPGASPVVLLSDRLWRSRFGADPGVIGEALTLETRPHTIVGVLPADFYFPDRETLLWTPLNLTPPTLPGVGLAVMLVPALARIRPDVTVAQAEAEGAAIRRGVSQRIFEDPEAPTLRVQLVPLQEEMVAETRPALLMLFAGVMTVMLIAAVNLANLLLARGVTRARELAIRAAIGASRWRLLRQLLTESLVLSVAGGALGLLAAYWGRDLLLSVAPGDISRVAHASFDPIVLGFGVSLSLATGLVCGSVPAFHGGRADLRDGANVGASTSVGVGRLRATRVRAALASAEIAFAVVLVVAAGLLVRSFDQMTDMAPDMTQLVS